MENNPTQKKIHIFFIIGLGFKALNSILEIFGGIFFLFTGSIVKLIPFLIQGELIEDPKDFIATHLQNILPYFSTHSQFYVSFYLFSHGIIKIILVISLIRNKLWAYPVTIITLLLFIIYQLYRLTFGFSIALVLLTIFDITIIILTWYEYQNIRNHPRFAK